MEPGQQPSSLKLFQRASARRRITAAFIFLAIAAVFLLAWLMGRYNITLYPFACGFKQRYGLPCPTCGMTHAVLAFAQGRIIRSFYVQPAAAFFCCLAIVTAFFALLIAVFGVYFPVFERRLVSLKLRYIVAALVFILAAGWAVTLARTLAEHSGF
jgi:hypothetical protein